jgi:large subunit ribosomal protein L31e
MAKPKTNEPKSILEREYIVPLRKEWLKVPEYKRASKAIKALKQFIAKHMKLYDTDLRKVKIDQLLNNEIRFRGMRKPPAKIKVKAIKLDNDTIRVELVDLPVHVKFKKAREDKKKTEVEKKVKEIKSKPPVEEKSEEKDKEKPKEDKEEKKEKPKESKEGVTEGAKPLAKEERKETKQAHKQQKSTSTKKEVKVNRKTLSR